MKYLFTCYGHDNITCKHKTTLEFTKDKDLSLKGDCIVGVKADFSLVQLKKFIKSLGNNKKITITIEAINKDYKITEKINAEINPGFNSNKEMVIRKTDFISERTFAIKSDKAACEVTAGLVSFLKDRNAVIEICLENRY